MYEYLLWYGAWSKLVHFFMNHSEANKGNLPPTLVFTSDKRHMQANMKFRAVASL